MLFVKGSLIVLTAIIVLLAIAALIALVTRASSPIKPMRPVVLSDQDRLLFQKVTFELRKQERLESKKRQQRLERKVAEDRSGLASKPQGKEP